MMQLVLTSDGVPNLINASLNGVPVFLDYFAIKKLAKEDARRWHRFTEAIRNGGDLLFSKTRARPTR